MEMSDGRLTGKALAQQDAAAAAVDHYRDDYIQLLGDLVRCPTLLGAERPAQDILYRHLQVMGLEAERWDLDPEDLSSHSTFAPVDWGYQERPNVRGTLKPAGRAGRSLVLNGHVDVVSPEPVDWWSYDPWGATITDGRMYGRGSMDMKAGLAAALLAIQAVMDTGVELRGPVIFESVIEEECTGNGMLASRIRSGKVDGAVITEPTGLQAWTATPGVLWFEVTVRGKTRLRGQGRSVCQRYRNRDFPDSTAQAGSRQSSELGFRPSLLCGIQESAGLERGKDPGRRLAFERPSGVPFYLPDVVPNRLVLRPGSELRRDPSGTRELERSLASRAATDPTLSWF